jgi:hypothetical protein
MKIKEAYRLSNSLSDKDLFHTYGETYDKLFEPFIDKPVQFCEVGFYQGESAVLFSHVFQHDDAVLDFIDIHDVNFNFNYINPRCFNNKRVNFHLLDILKIDEYDYFDKKYDIVIDDGCHSANFMEKSINFFSNKLNPGGILIIEDIRIEESPLGDPPNYPSCIGGHDPDKFELIKVPVLNPEVYDNNLLVYRA